MTSSKQRINKEKLLKQNTARLLTQPGGFSLGPNEALERQADHLEAIGDESKQASYQRQKKGGAGNPMLEGHETPPFLGGTYHTNYHKARA